MAFEMLQDRLTGLIKKIKGQSRLTESNVEDILKEIKIALIDADCNSSVVKSFLENCKTKMMGEEVIGKLNPSQVVVKIVNDEIKTLLGEEQAALTFAKQGPTAMMLVGLQGGGKTTMAAKLANNLKIKQNKNVMMVALDVYRPGAIDQLEQLGKQCGVFVYSDRSTKDVVKIASDAFEYAKYNRYDVVLLDTAGRLSIDDEMMDELVRLKAKLNPLEILLIVDAMLGQEAVNVASSFNDKLGLTGCLMTKLDGDARGGAALSIAYLTGVHIKYIGTGEKIKDLSAFVPERMANRILGMGDIVELVEKTQEAVDEKQAQRMVNRMLSGKFDLNDMLQQINASRKMGPLGFLIKLIPGMPKISKEDTEKAEENMNRTKVILQSMTEQERKHPEILKAERKIRIANGSGKQVSDVNFVLKQYEQMKEQMKQLQGLMRFRR